MVEDRALSDLAREIAPYSNDVAVGELTAQVIGAGHSIFQIYKLGETDREHVKNLLDLFCPPVGAVVLDLGCGVGTVAAMMAEERHDLRFVLLNVSRSQLGMCPPFPRVAADLEAIPLRRKCVDAVMALYALGHGHLDTVLSEARRVLKPGGVLFIYDIETDDESIVSRLGYVGRSAAQVEAAAFSHGFQHEFTVFPNRTSTRDAEQTLGDEFRLFAGTRPVIYRFSRTP